MYVHYPACDCAVPLRRGRSEEQVLSRLPRKPKSFSTRNFMS